jgi:hypothetical protein
VHSTSVLCCAAAPGVLPRSRFCRSCLSSERARKRALSCVSERARERALSRMSLSVVLLSSKRARERALSPQPRGSPVVFPGAARFLKALCILDSAYSAYSAFPRPRLLPPPPVPPSRVFRKKRLSPLRGESA